MQMTNSRIFLYIQFLFSYVIENCFVFNEKHSNNEWKNIFFVDDFQLKKKKEHVGSCTQTIDERIEIINGKSYTGNVGDFNWKEDEWKISFACLFLVE